MAGQRELCRFERMARAFAAAGVIVAGTAGAAASAGAPWAAREGADRCDVVAGAAPRIESVPLRWQEQVLRDHGWASPDARLYTVPPAWDCRAPPRDGRDWICHPDFIAWAKRNCAGADVRE